jgi:hypothetical protein
MLAMKLSQPKGWLGRGAGATPLRWGHRPHNPTQVYELMQYITSDRSGFQRCNWLSQLQGCHRPEYLEHFEEELE